MPSYTRTIVDAPTVTVGSYSDAAVANLKIRGTRPWIDVTADPYNADPSGATDSTTAIQAAIDAARAISQGPLSGSLSRAAIVFFPYGSYLVSSLDCTNSAGLHLIGKSSWGVALYADRQVSTSKPVLDFTGSSSCNIHGITIHGQTTAGADPSIIPSCGLLLAQTTAGANSNKNHIEDVGTLGKFTNAAVYIYSSTDNYFASCAFQQKQSGQPALFAANVNSYSQTSPYRTIATGTNNTGELTFVQCEFHDLVTASGASGTSTVRMQGVYSVRFYGGNNSSAGLSHLELLGTISDLILSGVEFYSDNDTAASYVIRGNGTTINGLTLDQCNYRPNIGTILGAITTASLYNGVHLNGKVTALGFTGNLVSMVDGSSLIDCLLQCDGLAVNVGASGLITRGLLFNPGTVTVGTNTSTRFGSAGGPGFYGSAPVAKQTSGADLTNSVTVGGTTDTIADFSDLTVYANSAAAIRNDIYQLSRKLKQVNDALRLYGLLT